MGVVVTPRELLDRSELYRQIGSSVGAGISILEALELQRSHPISQSFERPLAELQRRLRGGATLSGALEGLGSWMPEFDRAIVEAAETAGSLDATFKMLGEYYRKRAALARQAISASLYPLLVVHLAIVVFPTELLAGVVLRFEIAPFLAQKIPVFGLLYGAVFAVAWACQGQRGRAWRARVERALGAIPILSEARRSLAFARLSTALGALVTAGVGTIQAWPLAAEASGSEALRRAVDRWADGLRVGQTPSELLRQSPEFPSMFASAYATGEQSGKLDDTLGSLREHYQEEGSRKLADFARWAPMFFYGLVVVAVAWQIVGFYGGFFASRGLPE